MLKNFYKNYKLIFDEYRRSFEKQKNSIKQIKEVYKKGNLKENPTFFQYRIILNDTLEYANKNNMYFSKINIDEKMKQELTNNIYIEFNKKNYS